MRGQTERQERLSTIGLSTPYASARYAREAWPPFSLDRLLMPGDDKRHTVGYYACVKPFRWDPEKNERLKVGRGISFEEIIAAVEEDGLKDILVHPNQRRYPGQVVLVVAYRDYIFLVPSVEEKAHYFLKTIIPSRKATRDYLRTGANDEES